MGRPRPPGSHCRFERGIELVRDLDCCAIRLLCQGDHLPSAGLTLGPGSLRDDAMATTIAHLFDEYHSLKSEVFGPKGNRSRRASTAKTVLGRSDVLELHSADLPCPSLDDALRRPTTPYGALRCPTTPNTSLRFPTFPFWSPKRFPNDALRFPTIPFKCATLDAVIRSFGDSRPRPDRAWQLMRSLAFTFVGPR